MRKRGIERDQVALKADVSEEVIEKHYEELSDEEIVESRRDQFDEEYDDELEIDGLLQVR